MTKSWERERQDLLLKGYARSASIPVINLESAMEHPCQAIADVFTIRERLQRVRGKKLTLCWCNHPDQKSPGASHSVLLLAATLGMEVTLTHPLGFELDDEIVQRAKARAAAAGGAVKVVNDLTEGARGTDVVYARSWASLKHWGDPERESMQKRALQSWIVDEKLMGTTNDAILMHPLPVRRNVVATDAVLDGKNSVIYDQAENRVHVQKALLTQLLQ
jgi:N-acetylornithine carbamoyltransferase